MSTLSIRQELIEKLDGLNDEQIRALLHVVRAFEGEGQFESLPDEYDESKDSLIAMFSGPTDLDERSKNILENEFGVPSDWKSHAS